MTTDDQRWRQVVERDRSAEDRFVLGVTTTGIFCRPGCPARTPKREHVEFFPDAGSALRAGYRPCKRCRPLGLSIQDETLGKIQRACRIIDDSDRAPTLDELAAAVHLSPYHFHRTFKSVMGLTPKQYADLGRQERIRRRLRAGGTVTDAIFDAGFSSSGQYYARHARRLGMHPSTYQKGGRGAHITWVTVPSTLGLMLLAETRQGLCFLQFGDDEASLLDELKREYPFATIDAGDRSLADRATTIAGAMNDPATLPALPIDVAGTDLQLRVWAALRDIPSGSTMTYGEMAQKVGAPNAIRAVASACAKNPVAVLVPCHRVVRSNGDLAGYRSGIERKRQLLEREHNGHRSPV